MSEGAPNPPAADAAPTEAADFYAAVLRRLHLFICIAALPALAAAAWRWGAPGATGCLIGALLAGFNLWWLERGVSRLIARLAGGEQLHGGGSVVLPFLLRYLLLFLVAYAIFNVSQTALYGFLAGLFVPVAALLGEAASEAWQALRHSPGS